MKSLWPTALALTARLVLSGVLLASGAVKLLDFVATERAVAGYQMLPAVLVFPAALILPWTEIVVALALWLPGVRRAARGLVCALLLVFLVALFGAWIRGLDITCGCFGGTGIANYPWLIARDIGLLFLLWLENKNSRKIFTRRHEDAEKND